MSARLGISVSGDAVRGVLVRRGRIVWHARSPIGVNETAGAALDHLLAELPSARVGSVRIALGSASSRVKRLEGLPPVRQPRLLDRIVKENADAFFLRLGARTMVIGVERCSDGSVWGAALEAALVDELLGVLRRRRLSRASLMPFAVALTTIEGGVIREHRRGVPDVPSVALHVAALEALGADGHEFASAYGAAISRSNAAFTWRPPRNRSHARALDIVRLAAASLLLASSLGAALFARGAHASRIAAVAAIKLTVLRDSQIAAVQVDANLRKVTAELDRIHRFEAERGRMTVLMGALSEALPDSTALTSLRVDSVDVSFVALAPRAAEVLPQLIDLPGVVAPRIVGSVTREVQGSARVERASFRLRRQRVPR